VAIDAMQVSLGRSFTTALVAAIALVLANQFASVFGVARDWS